MTTVQGGVYSAIDAIRDACGQDSKPELLRHGSNMLFRVGENLVARATPVGKELERSLLFAETAASLDLPVLRPIDTQIHRYGDWQITFWPYLEPCDGTLDYFWLGHTARMLHAQARVLRETLMPAVHTSELAQVQFTKIAQRLERMDQSGYYERDDIRFLGQQFELLQQHWEQAHFQNLVVVHGDLYGGNVLLTKRGPLLIDFDRVMLAPRAWDQVPTQVQIDHFGLHKSALVSFMVGYGEDLASDENYGLLMRCRKLSSITWAGKVAIERPELVPEARRCLASLTQESLEPWIPR